MATLQCLEATMSGLGSDASGWREMAGADESVGERYAADALTAAQRDQLAGAKQGIGEGDRGDIVSAADVSDIIDGDSRVHRAFLLKDGPGRTMCGPEGSPAAGDGTLLQAEAEVVIADLTERLLGAGGENGEVEADLDVDLGSDDDVHDGSS
jgi:hypothetical protein